MQNGTTVTLNDKGIVLIGAIILALVFALGFMVSQKVGREQNVTIFTREDLQRISKVQAMEDLTKSGAEVFAYKDKDGNLIIGYNYEESKKGGS